MSLSELQLIKENFLKELKDAEAGKETSLAFIRHQLPSFSLVKNQEVFQALVIGGSVCVRGILKKNGTKIDILSFEVKPQPSFLTRDDLFDFIEQELDPQVRVVALNFAYAIKPVYEQGKLDGILLNGSKENTFKGLINQKICFEIEEHIKTKYNRTLLVSAANDTICLLLSGAGTFPRHSLGAGVLGTGYNLAFFLDENHCVNLESGNFNKFPLSQEVKDFDKISADPGKHLFEKEVSGAYLYHRFNCLLKTRGLQDPPLSSTKEMDDLAQQNIPRVSALAIELFTYSAGLVAAQLAAVSLFKEHNMTFMMEGSFFWKAHNYKELIQDYLKQLLPNYSIGFEHIEKSTVLGAAKLVA